MIVMLQTLLAGANSHTSEALFLFLLTFLREDVAIVLSGFLIVEHRMPLGPVLANLHAGILVVTA